MANQSNGPDFWSTMEGCYNRLHGGCVLMIANVLFVVAFAWVYYAFSNDLALSRSGQSTTGIVVSLHESYSEDRSCCVYTPVVEFDHSGQTYTFQSSLATSPPRYQVGEQVSVLYHPDNPELADIEGTFTSSPLFPAAGLGLIVVLALVINFFFIRSIWRGEPIDKEG
jgi:hypothetical protein